MEAGRDFTFIDDESEVQVGGEDYKIDLLFFLSAYSAGRLLDQRLADLSQNIFEDGFPIWAPVAEKKKT